MPPEQPPKTMKVVITFPVLVDGMPKKQGEVIELETKEARYLVGLGRASFDIENAKKIAKAGGKAGDKE